MLFLFVFICNRDSKESGPRGWAGNNGNHGEEGPRGPYGGNNQTTGPGSEGQPTWQAPPPSGRQPGPLGDYHYPGEYPAPPGAQPGRFPPIWGPAPAQAPRRDDQGPWSQFPQPPQAFSSFPWLPNAPVPSQILPNAVARVAQAPGLPGAPSPSNNFNSSPRPQVAASVPGFAPAHAPLRAARGPGPAQGPGFAPAPLFGAARHPAVAPVFEGPQAPGPAPASAYGNGLAPVQSAAGVAPGVAPAPALDTLLGQPAYGPAPVPGVTVDLGADAPGAAPSVDVWPPAAAPSPDLAFSETPAASPDAASPDAVIARRRLQQTTPSATPYPGSVTNTTSGGPGSTNGSYYVIANGTGGGHYPNYPRDAANGPTGSNFGYGPYDGNGTYTSMGSYTCAGGNGTEGTQYGGTYTTSGQYSKYGPGPSGMCVSRAQAHCSSLSNDQVGT